jgi:mRNA-degrading endonuclease RelE of RelBE toxin-antitoxin system
VFAVEITVSALQEIGALRAFDEKTILAAIEEQLSHEPLLESRNRKKLTAVVPRFQAVLPVWELRVGEHRIFYDVNEDEMKVYVRAVRHKPPHKTTEEIL